MPHAGEGHGHAVLVACLDALLILDAAARLDDEPQARRMGEVDGVAEWKERIAGL